MPVNYGLKFVTFRFYTWNCAKSAKDLLKFSYTTLKCLWEIYSCWHILWSSREIAELFKYLSRLLINCRTNTGFSPKGFPEKSHGFSATDLKQDRPSSLRWEVALPRNMVRGRGKVVITEIVWLVENANCMVLWEQKHVAWPLWKPQFSPSFAKVLLHSLVVNFP